MKGGKRLSEEERATILTALKYVCNDYGERSYVVRSIAILERDDEPEYCSCKPTAIGVMERTFLQKPYTGTDGDDFIIEFREYLESAISNRRWDAMSDYILFLQGAKSALLEVIDEMYKIQRGA